MRCAIALSWALLAMPALADVVVPVHTIRPQSVIGQGDLALRPLPGVEGFDSVDELIGLEARVALYAGRPIRPQDVGPPATIERNQLVLLVFARGELEIRAEGRALDRAGKGEVIKVMNTSSRNIVMGVVRPDGTVLVQ
ncbi:MAG: flagella basal body P-ring formation protein FlgA [Rhodobacteraceae bacterium HLUCCO07]|uniref:flagellar basal body P-ring formation chaperone FlgA n=1 Tax=Aquicoccus sp. TaxID=2055851 RepID=UPI0006DA1D09|nr:MAG: flagella basal body P-ring formation protein FlgA [Rhodobacteraceae bacterium HLUCCO07]